MMTRINDTSSLAKPDVGQPSSQSPSADNYLTIESLLQGHNDLILAIHKSFTDSTTHINRSIATLTEEIRQVKTFMHQVVSDRSLKDELVNWRSHTESLIDRSDQNHQREIQRLIDLFERLNTGHSMAIQPAQLGLAQQQQQLFFAQQMQQHQALMQAFQNQQNVASQKATAPVAQPPPIEAAAAVAPSKLPSQTGVNIFHQEPSQVTPTLPVWNQAKETTKEKPKTEKPKEQPKQPAQGNQAPLSALDQFKPKAGSWSCPMCMVTNSADAKECPCCNTAKPGQGSSAQQIQKSTFSSSTTTAPQKSQTVKVKQEMEKTPPVAAAQTAVPIATNTQVTAPAVGSGPFKLITAQPTSQATPPNNATGTGAAPPSIPNFKFCPPSATTPTATPPAAPSATATAGGNAFPPFSFGASKGPLFGGGISSSGSGFPGFKPPANTPTSATPPTATMTGIGTSLFGGSKANQQNTFGAFAQKANQGGGFLGGSGGSGVATTQAPAATSSPAGASPFGQRTGLFGTTNARPAAAGAGGHDEEEDGEASERPEAFVPDAHFEPVIPLPELVEARTGEEDEQVIFSARCKLYRFDKAAKENKEKGVGEMKILYNASKRKYRCVMRRDQVLKLCANFYVPAGLKITVKEHVPTAYTWVCRDYSDLEKPQGEDEVLCARFKDADTAKDFARKMEEASKGNAGGSGGSSGGGGPSPPGGPSGSNGPSRPAGGDGQSSGSSSGAGGAGAKTVPDLINHQKQGGGGGTSGTTASTPQQSSFTQWREVGKTSTQKAYEEERGGYEDDVEDADYGDEEGAYDEEEEDQLLYEAKCQLQLADEYVSPLKKDAHKPSIHPNCDLALYKSNGVYRVDFTNSGGAGKTVFSHYIYQNSHVGELNGINQSQPGKAFDYKALNIHSNMAAKRVTVSFASPTEATEFEKHFGEGAKLAEQIGFDEADDQ